MGHKGADAIVAGNTLASFDAALAVGVDMIELDVLAERADGSGELYVVHDHAALARHGAPSLEAALAHLTAAEFDDVRLQIDLKRRGYEEQVVDALEAAGALGRSMITTAEWASLVRVRARAPALRIGWTVGVPLAGVPLAGPLTAHMFRSGLARTAANRLRDGAIDALIPQWPLVTRRLVQAVHGAGGEIYAWTVDDPRMIRRLAELGVTGVITNDPRLFAQLS
ncbi:MAG: glycerophosphodiester phosphodiesterase [Solirubrobacteraceae bacterium]